MTTEHDTSPTKGHHGGGHIEKDEEDVFNQSGTTSTLVNCRMYEQRFPEIDDVVIAEVKSIEEMGAYVSLKEYNDIEGMILLSELSRRRIRSINKIIRVGRLEVVVVLRVDKEKGYIDLSKRRVSEEDIIKAEEKYNKSKAVHSIMRHVAESVHQDLEALYTQIAWPLFRKYGHAYDGFKLVLNDPDTQLGGFNLSPEVRQALLVNVKRRLTPQPVKVRADIEVSCFHYEGIDAVKAALTKGEETSTEAAPVKIKLVAPPLYVAVTTSTHKEIGIKALNTAIDAIKEEILKRNGIIAVRVAPRTVHERDEKELSTLLEKLERENREVPADEPGSDDD